VTGLPTLSFLTKKLFNYSHDLRVKLARLRIYEGMMSVVALVKSEQVELYARVHGLVD